MRTTFSIFLCILNCRITSDHKSLQEVLMASRATSTVAKYRKAFEDWKSWCAINCVCELPAQKADIARYYMSMYNNDAPYSRIEGAHFGIKWFLDCSPVTEVNPCNSRFLHLLLAGLKRILAHPKCKKEPITPDILNKLVNKYGCSNCLKEARLCSMTLLAYAGFFRHAELVELRECDISVHTSHVKCFIQHSKTDQYREGAWVIIAATGKPTCPVAMLNKYMLLGDIIPGSSEEYLFRALTLKKSLKKYVLRGGKLSYTTCRDLFKAALSSIGLDSSYFGLHSLRAGGASAAAALGISDRLFKKHGRWKSDSAKDGYVKESLKNQLSVSLNLGI